MPSKIIYEFPMLQSCIEYFAIELYKSEDRLCHNQYNREQSIEYFTDILDKDIAVLIVNEYEHYRIEETHNFCEDCNEWLKEETYEFDENTYCQKHYDIRLKREEFESDEDKKIDAIETKYRMMKEGTQ